MASWGRHGWPKKNETARLYQDCDKSYILVFIDDDDRGDHEAVGNVYTEPEPPSLVGCSVNNAFIYEKCQKRVQWSELPAHWQAAFRHYMRNNPGEPPWNPDKIRGFWLVGKQPATA